MQKKILLLISLFGFLFLTGCGGGGGDSTTTVTTSTDSTETAYLLDSAVQGVEYISEINGLTESNGSFSYKKGNNITFKIGNLILGEMNKIPIDKNVFIQDLVGIDRNETNENVSKIAQLLQSLDNDNNLSNGISIDKNISDLITINKKIKDMTVSEVEDLISSLNKDIIPKYEALTHVNETISENTNILTETYNEIEIISDDLNFDLIKLNNERQTAIFSDLNLITVLDGANIIWKSSNPEIISETGKIIKSDSYKTVQLTATLTKDNLTIDKSFILTVIPDVYKFLTAQQDALTFDVIKKENLSPYEITGDLNLITSQDGANISWSSNNIYAINIDGTVNRGIVPLPINLIATIEYQGSWVTKEFLLTVIPNPILVLNDIKKKLIFDDFKGSNLYYDKITSDLYFPEFIDGVNIKWQSLSPDIISNFGLVNRTGEDEVVTLIATLSIDDESITKTFTLIVLADPNLILQEQIDNLSFNDFKNLNINPESITTNLDFPLNIDGTILTWNSDNTNAIDNNGIVNRLDLNTIVNITAYLTRDGITLNKIFNLTVLSNDNQIIVDSAYNNLTWDVIKNQNIRKEKIIGNLNLLTFFNDTEINWEISDTNVFNQDGTLKDLSNYWDEEIKNNKYNIVKKIQLTATITKNTISQTKIFFVYLRQPIRLKEIPTVVILINSNNFQENDPTLWANKIFNNIDSVSKYYEDNTNLQYKFIPIQENEGIANDGIITINTGIDHPGDITMTNPLPYISDYVDLIDQYIDFSKYASTSNLSSKELNIIFIMAGGEASYGDDEATSVWGHSFSFQEDDAPVKDGIKLFFISRYSLFGSNHGNHKATRGIMVHELGHAIFNLSDYYDIDGGSSGLGIYDVMSSGSWEYNRETDTYPGETPTGFTSVNKYEMNTLRYSNANTYSDDESIETTEEKNSNNENIYTLKCSDTENVNINNNLNLGVDRQFLIECRDTNNKYDKTFSVSFGFPENSLYLTVYHYNDDRFANYQEGVQDYNNHYRAYMIESDTTKLMTDSLYIYADYADVFINGDFIPSDRFKFFENTNDKGMFNIEILNEDLINRTMTFRITYL